MILYAPPTASAAAPAARMGIVEHATSSRTFQSAASGGTPGEAPLITTENLGGVSVELCSARHAVRETLNWNDSKVLRDFVRLEQKVLARKATQDESERYEVMKRDRHSEIFADRFVRDYAEVQRLRRLNKKLAEIQQLLRPSFQ